MCDPEPKAVALVDPQSGAKRKTLAMRGVPVWSPDGRLVAAIDDADATLAIGDAKTGMVRVAGHVDMKRDRAAGDGVRGDDPND